MIHKMKAPSQNTKCCRCLRRSVVDIRVKDNFGYMLTRPTIADAKKDVDALRHRGMCAYYVSEKNGIPYAVEGYRNGVGPCRSYAVFLKPVGFPARPIRFRPMTEAKGDEFFVLNNQYSTIGTNVHLLDVSRTANYLKFYSD